MEFSLSAAAKAVGKGKSTIHNAIKTGKLSARREEDGSYKIDASELARVFGLNAPGTVQPDEPEPRDEPDGTELAVLRTKVMMLEDKLARERQVSEDAKDTIGDLRRRLDKAEERIHALLPPPVAERHQGQVIGVASGTTVEPRARGLLARLLGR